MNHVIARFGLSVRRSCRILGVSRSTYLYENKRGRDAQIVERMRAIIASHPRAGSRMITMYLHQEGSRINHKRVERIYVQNKMQLKNRRGGRRKYRAKKRPEHILSQRAGEWLAMDFVIDSIASKRRLKSLTVIDPVSKVAPRIVPAYSMGGREVAGVLEEMWRRQRFGILQTDNGPEFRSHDVQEWCEEHGVRQVFSRPGKPTDNCFIESFNRIFREECLNVNYFSSLAEARQIIEAWRIHYNGSRPQKGLKELTPNQFKHRLESMKDSP